MLPFKLLLYLLANHGHQRVSDKRQILHWKLYILKESRIYGEIGPGERVALSKLSIEKFERTGVPLRIAIDISIWSFQIQAGQGKEMSEHIPVEHLTYTK